MRNRGGRLVYYYSRFHSVLIQNDLEIVVYPKKIIVYSSVIYLLKKSCFVD